MAGKKGMNKYSLEMKIKAVSLFFEEGKNQNEIAEELGVLRRDTISEWIQIYRKEGFKGLKKERGRKSQKEISQKDYISRLEMENAILKKYHTELREIVLAKRDIGSLNHTKELTQ